MARLLEKKRCREKKRDLCVGLVCFWPSLSRGFVFHNVKVGGGRVFFWFFCLTRILEEPGKVGIVF